VSPGAAIDAASAWRLRDEEQFLVRSLADATGEHEAGDLSDDDFRLLTARDGARLEEVRRQLAGPAAAEAPEPAQGTLPAPAPPQRRRRQLLRFRRRWWVAVTGVALIVAGVALLLVERQSPRLPGQTPTGGVTLNAEQQVAAQLSQAATLLARHDTGAALRLYDTVLTEDPRQPEALAQWGWLEWGVGERRHDAKLVGAGTAFVEAALQADPHFTAAHLYLGTIDEAAGDDTAAVVQYRQFLAADPTAVWIRDSALLIEQAYRATGQPVPPQVLADAPAGSATTPTPPRSSPAG
jgi:tetratricopeptide (TPR) repeat protein